ncbi:BREX-1 system phosphatase PglZ type A [Longimonas halophila]|uniref:BREX-1 system phosphatase PglZ type A n=1 Tax=Longimonas halophila TaxID=1469170 RepID=A0A2H3NWW0_9BACT|nr:BREX-1 system phosphatase PglZ type A [Longimonas halophila]PEN09424.1 BREX-1 system phosphatase PglZ type A [Longimonas halophila]
MPKTLETRAEEHFERRSALRVLFLFDPDEDHREAIRTWDHPEIECIEATQPGLSTIYHIEKQGADANVLLYTPRRRPTTADLSSYPLADLLIANAELTVDEAAELADERDLRPEQRRLVQQYYDSDLRYKNRRRFLGSTLSRERLTEDRLKRGLAAYYLDLFGAAAPSSTNHVIAGVFIRARDEEGFADYQEACAARDLDDWLGQQMAQRFALDRVAFSHEMVKTAAKRLKYNLLTQPLDTVSADDPYRTTLRVEQTSVLTRMRDLVNEWDAHNRLSPSYQQVLDTLAPEVDEARLMQAYGSEASFGYLTPALRRERLRQAVALLPEQPETSQQTVQSLRSSDDQAAAEAAHVVWHMAAFYRHVNAHATLDVGALDAFVDTYTTDLYRCDTHYREAVRIMQTIRREQSTYRSVIDDAYESFLHAYADQFVQAMNIPWQQKLEAEAASQPIRDALRIPPLDQFYTRYVASVEKKTAVIISDGLRYEVAAALDNALQSTRRKHTTLDATLAPIPSITSLGKACLLPHHTLALDADAAGIQVDGTTANSTRQRSKLLKAGRSDAEVFRFDDLNGLTTDEGRARMKEHSLVYIYHDRIDRYGDKADTETDTPTAAYETVSELQGFIQKLNNWNVRRVLITADHGFLYDDSVPDAMQEPFPPTTRADGTEGYVVRRNRCVVADAVAAEHGYQFEVPAVSPLTDDWQAVVPRAVNRYNLSGAGKRYAHGGASLQELVVPVLEVETTRTDIAEKVDVRLLTSKNTILSGVLKAEFLQMQSISNTVRPRTIQVGLYDDQDALISNSEKLEMDVVAPDDPGQRTHTCLLELMPQADDLNACHLRAHDIEDTLNPIIDQPFTIQRHFGSDF